MIGLGLDLVEIDRIAWVIERKGPQFLKRVFTEKERAYCQKQKTPEANFAARFAAKEAVAKAIGTGIGKGAKWTEIEVVRAPSGQPQVKLTGSALESAKRRGIGEIKVSITHTKGVAAATAMSLPIAEEP